MALSDNRQAVQDLYQLLGGDPDIDWHIYSKKGSTVTLCGLPLGAPRERPYAPGDPICPVCALLHSALGCNCGIGGLE